jgi:hypothetical protein
MAREAAEARTAEDLKRAQQITAQMATDVENQVREWEEVQRLLAAGLISQETANRFDEQQLKPIEITRRKLLEFESESERVAKAIGENFRDAFAGWIAGADHDFKQLLKNMAAQMIASGIFQAIGSAFTKGSFFSNFFAGTRAEGGPVSGGRGYLVGEEGPEYFVPNVSGRVLNREQMAAGSGSVHVEQHLHFDVALESVDDRIRSAAQPLSQATMAALMKFVNRPRIA